MNSLITHLPNRPQFSETSCPGGQHDALTSRIVSLAMVALYSVACYAAVMTGPTAFGIGLGGMIVGLYATKLAVSLASQIEMIKKSSIYPLIDDIVAMGVAAGTTYLGCTIGATAAKITLLPALLCTLAGYYIPITALHEIRALPN